MITDEKPLGRRNYEQFASRYADAAPTKLANALYERPATLSLLPELAGLDVLDAGCGSGIYSEILARGGARVHAIDVTPEMIEIARSRLAGLDVDLRQADLARPLDWLPDRRFDLVLCPLALDYIADWHGVFAEFHRVARPGAYLVFSVGHPMNERLQAQKIDAERDPSLIGLFPGSRQREVRKIFPVMIETARVLLQGNPSLHFEVAAASEELAQEISELLAINPLTRAREEKATEQGFEVIQIAVGETAALMQRAFVGIVASGSATLEAAYYRMPFVLIYKVAWPTYLGARLVVNVEYLGMPNLLAGKEVVPEFIQHRADPGAIAGVMRPLMEHAPAREQMISEFDTIIGKLGTGGATERAARAVIEEISDGA